MINPEAEEVARINALTQEEMAKLHRFAPLGHKYFDIDLPYYQIFAKRFSDLGGMTPEISKRIGF